MIKVIALLLLFVISAQCYGRFVRTPRFPYRSLNLVREHYIAYMIYREQTGFAIQLTGDFDSNGVAHNIYIFAQYFESFEVIFEHRIYRDEVFNSMDDIPQVYQAQWYDSSRIKIKFQMRNHDGFRILHEQDDLPNDNRDPVDVDLGGAINRKFYEYFPNGPNQSYVNCYDRIVHYSTYDQYFSPRLYYPVDSPNAVCDIYIQITR